MVEGESSLPIKDQPSFKGQIGAGWPQVESGSEGGAAAGWDCGVLHLIQVKQSLVQHPLSTVVLLWYIFSLSSESSIVYSSLATNLSANSAQVSS